MTPPAAPSSLTEKLRSAAVVGAGRMGRAMIRHMLGKGFAVTASDVDRKALNTVAALGAAVAARPAEAAAASDAVFVAVGFDREVAAVCRGEDGIFNGARPGTIVVVNSTVSDILVRALAQEAEERGLVLLDIPIARGAAAAEAGTLLALAGGDPEALDRVRPMLNAFCSDIAHLGEVGHGQTAKAINNLLLWVNGVALMEAGNLAESTGIDLPALREALLLSSGKSWALENWDSVTFTWALNDMQLVLEMCDRAGLSMPMMGLVKEQVKQAKAAKKRGEAPWTRR